MLQLVFGVYGLPLETPFMDCLGAPYCGILVLERGDGGGNYHHEIPQVHGLWPENGKYGNSKCVNSERSQTSEMPSVSCYTDEQFQIHEWTKHGVCASRDPKTYFNIVCEMSKHPLDLMANLKAKGYLLEQMAQELIKSGIPVFGTDHANDQLKLSACAGSDGVWKLSNNFAADCLV